MSLDFELVGNSFALFHVDGAAGFLKAPVVGLSDTGFSIELKASGDLSWSDRLNLWRERGWTGVKVPDAVVFFPFLSGWIGWLGWRWRQRANEST